MICSHEMMQTGVSNTHQFDLAITPTNFEYLMSKARDMADICVDSWLHRADDDKTDSPTIDKDPINNDGTNMHGNEAEGMSDETKAGIAVGVVAGFIVVLSVVVAYRRSRRHAHSLLSNVSDHGDDIDEIVLNDRVFEPERHLIGAIPGKKRTPKSVREAGTRTIHFELSNMVERGSAMMNEIRMNADGSGIQDIEDDEIMEITL